MKSELFVNTAIELFIAFRGRMLEFMLHVSCIVCMCLLCILAGSIQGTTITDCSLMERMFLFLLVASLVLFIKGENLVKLYSYGALHNCSYKLINRS